MNTYGDKKPANYAYGLEVEFNFVKLLTKNVVTIQLL